MKALFFLILTANFGFFMWEYKTGAFLPHTQTTQSADLINREPVLLASELKNVLLPPPPEQKPESSIQQPIDNAVLATPAPDAIALQPTPEEEPWHCYEVGPFTGKSSYQKWINQLTDIKSKIKPVSRNEPVINKYRVYYPAADTFEKSRINAQMLKDLGVKDLLLLTTKEEKGEISLGVFSTEIRALALKTQLLGKGVKTNVKPLYITSPQKFARFRTHAKVMENFEILKKTYPKLTIKPIDSMAEDCE
ncbi:MAG: hypothetical protein ACXW1W_07625 [Methylococcaceae bacterium]